MIVGINEDFIRVVILDTTGLYSQIYDEIYCDKNKYSEILEEFGGSDKYKVIKV